MDINQKEEKNEMDTVQAYMRGQANRGEEERVFDWEKAAQIIKERRPKTASAGLIEDWGYTGGSIYENGACVPPEHTYTFLCSTWATPVLVLDDEQMECWRMESATPGWSCDTYWPEEALAILNAE